jgi:molybdate transport system substrate-binding protein
MRVFLLVFALAWGEGLAAASLRVAVASNFRNTLEPIAESYTRRTGVSLKISSASTGVLYSQVIYGAPFDLLLAADSERPRRLVESGHALSDSRVIYAYGQLVLAYTSSIAGRGASGISGLLALPGIDVAVANPTLAPYGRAAREVLDRAPLSDTSRLLTAANVGQAYQMWHSGGAELALLAASYRPTPSLPVPEGWHDPIAQEAVILSASARIDSAREFLEFLGSEAVRELIEQHGYRAPVGAARE